MPAQLLPQSAELQPYDLREQHSLGLSTGSGAVRRDARRATKTPAATPRRARRDGGAERRRSVQKLRESVAIAPSCSPRKCCGDPNAGPVLGGVDLVDLKRCVDRAGAPSSPDCAPTVGSVNATYGGYTFAFRNASNRDAFESDPRPYLPATGGFCSFSLTGFDENGAGFWCACAGHEDGYAYVDGAAHFFLFGGAKASFLRDGAGNMTANWRALLEENGAAEGACFNTARLTSGAGDDDDPCAMRSCLAYLDCHDCPAS